MVQFNGNEYGSRSYFVFSGTGGTSANFITRLDLSSGSTSSYVTAGGSTFATDEELKQFIGNNAYLNFKRTENFTSSQLNTDGITTSSSTFIPDPRIVVGFFVGEGLTGNHMDEIHYTASGGITVQGFLGRITYSVGHTEGGSTLVPEGQALLELVSPGISGGPTPTGIFTLGTGLTVSNITNSITGITITNSEPLIRIPVNSYRKIINGQAIGSVTLNQLNAAGLTGITIGDSSQIRHVRINPYSKDLLEFVKTSMVIVSSSDSITGDSDRISSIFTTTAVSGDGSTAYGININAITGGTVANTSMLSEFNGKVVNKKTQIDNIAQSVIYTLNQETSVRGIDEVSF